MDAAAITPPNTPGTERMPLVDEISKFVPKLAEIIREHCFGDIWTRPGLSQRDRSLITCAALICLNRNDELRLHILRAKRNGVSSEELSELIVHLSVYAGIPAVIPAATIGRETYSDGPAG